MAQTVLVLAPHTDDGEFGCGGTIAKFALNGASVHYVAFSAAEQSLPPELPGDSLRREVVAATQILGIPAQNLEVLNFRVRHFPAQRQDILEFMVRLSARLEPDIVLLPSGTDTHQDHGVIASEGFRAFKRTTMLGYELPWNNLDFRTSCFVELDEECVEKKVEALGCYRSQRHRPYASEEFVRSLMVTRGTQIGRRYAEAFEVFRWIVR